MEEFLKLDLSLLRSGLIFFCCCRDGYIVEHSTGGEFREGGFLFLFDWQRERVNGSTK